MSQINADTVPNEDLLNRRAFASEIARSLKISFTNGEDSFVLGINGKWGSGKTTLMKYLNDSLQQELSNEKRNVFFDFNPWMFSGRDELLSLFLDQLAKKLSVKKLKAKISAFADALSYLDWLKYVNTTAGNIQELAKHSFKKMGSKSGILELKKDIDTTIVENHLRIFVFIDDLDRLTPKEVIEVFQIIKLNASFKNTIFVIAYDKAVVQEILQQHHGVNGERYLEKIVQVDYRVPDPLDEILQNIFFTTLKNFLRDIDAKCDEVEFLVIWTVRRLKYYFLTLRDIYRYFNALKLRLPAIKKDVDLYQFCVIEAIRVFDYDAYELIQRNYKMGVMFGPQTESNRILSDSISNENTRDLFNYLFEQRG